MFETLLSKRIRFLLTAVFMAGLVLPVSGLCGIEQDPVVRDVTFSLTRLPENPKQYSLVLSDPDERTISGVFSLDQLQILKALMNEAEKFALSEEGVGVKEAIVTRFADKQEQSFVIDVEKLGIQSRLFVTLSTDLGRMTADAGRINRSVKREEGFFFDLLDRIEALLPKSPK